MANKPGLSKRELTTPRLRNIATHMAVNLTSKINALRKQNITSIKRWTGSTVTLHWLSDNKTCKVFPLNR